MGVSVIQGRGDRHVAGHTHDCEEEDAGVHVHHSDRQDDFAHGVTKRPAEVQRGVHGPEGQREHELQVGHGQVKHKKIHLGLFPFLFNPDEEQHQQVSNQPCSANHRIDDADEESQNRAPVSCHVDVLQFAEETHVR